MFNSEQQHASSTFAPASRFRGTPSAAAAAACHNNDDKYSNRDKPPTGASHSPVYLFVALVVVGLVVIAVPFYLRVLPFQNRGLPKGNIENLPHKQHHHYQLTTPRPPPPPPPQVNRMGLEKLGYEIIRQSASSQVVSRSNRVTVHALGSVLEASGGKKKFWSTRDEGAKPFQYTAGVGEVIKGWDDGVLGMKQGEVRGISIPGNQGYGVKGFPAWGIPPNADLHFEIEVLSIDITK
eukprot:GHVS01073736.1.p1 GENE.GHVS01073736.1~~GHVS01073736.1.p1  ORF type:complete len:237 (+),score=39.35 GHVS01073736.1:144-854(+)